VIATLVVGAHAGLITTVSWIGNEHAVTAKPPILILQTVNEAARPRRELDKPVTNIAFEPTAFLPMADTVPVVWIPEVEAQGMGVVVAPQLIATESPDSASFAVKAGLSAGESAVVVLRIEVLADGTVGQVKVDVSCGRDPVDAVAIEYAKHLVWIPGRLSGVDSIMWVRQGVRLAA
jgi:TonB family protein